MTTSRDSIVVVGGYGAVGKVIVSTLAPLFPGRVTVAGRNIDQATAFARSLPQPVSALQFDVERQQDFERGLQGARVVIMCTERHNLELARYCLENGIHYIDISATSDILFSIQSLHQLAVDKNATAALSIGLAPGLTNLLAQQCFNKLPNATSVEITILAGLGERHGAQAVEWTVDNFGVPVDSSDGLATAASTYLPGFGFRTAHRFPFSDQDTLKKSFNIPVATRLCFDSGPTTALMFALRKIGVFRLMRWLKAEPLVAWFFTNFHFGTDRFVVQATASNSQGKRLSWSASGRVEAKATGVVAALVAKELYTQSKPRGVLQIEQLIEPEAFFRELEATHQIKFNYHYHNPQSDKLPPKLLELA